MGGRTPPTPPKVLPLRDTRPARLDLAGAHERVESGALGALHRSRHLRGALDVQVRPERGEITGHIVGAVQDGGVLRPAMS